MQINTKLAIEYLRKVKQQSQPTCLNDLVIASGIRRSVVERVLRLEDDQLYNELCAWSLKHEPFVVDPELAKTALSMLRPKIVETLVAACAEPVFNKSDVHRKTRLSRQSVVKYYKILRSAANEKEV